ncbi:signal peptidase II [Sphingomonas aracearum]|uniref:Lipoprotein signal peptidase n=1 Tax=Sphingomonas aracearum TaxID=2283317 RepID=A0A369VWD1_9SPHN|nr:signal peptidase II [Sphingomonas aracearum]RDE05382.1 signal peptidase II [Sphingomonas aracearum]
MSRVPVAGLATAAVLFAADQAVKYAVTDVMQLNELTGEHVVTGFFNLRFVANRGVSLGMLHATSDTMRWGLVAFTAAIAAIVLVWMIRERNRGDQIALGLVLGGAIGNILDRVRFGYVVDYADLHFGEWRPFLVFNLADAAITIGVLVLLVRAIVSGGKADAESDRVENGNA